MASSWSLSKSGILSFKALGSHCTFELWIDEASCSFGTGIQVSAVLWYQYAESVFLSFPSVPQTQTSLISKGKTQNWYNRNILLPLNVSLPACGKSILGKPIRSISLSLSLNTFFVYSSLKFAVKLRGKYRDVPYTLYPKTCTEHGRNRAVAGLGGGGTGKGERHLSQKLEKGKTSNCQVISCCWSAKYCP